MTNTTTTPNTTTTTTTTTRKGATAPSKAQVAETTKALTASQTKSLETLALAARESMAGAERAESALGDIVTQLADFKVYAARSLAKLSVHPAVKATRGTKAGQAAVTKMATVIGRPANTVATYWKGAEALITKGWQNRTAAPTQAERDLVMAGFKSEAARVSAYKAPAKDGGKGKGKGGKPVVKSSTVTVDSIGGMLDGALEAVTGYTGTMGFTKDQANELATKLDAILDAIEAGVAK